MTDQPLHTDSHGRTWHVLERADRSVVIFYTLPDLPVHFVVFDTLDDSRVRIAAEPPTEPATTPWYGVI